MKVFVVVHSEPDREYYMRENHDPFADVRICSVKRVCSTRAKAEKYINDCDGKNGYRFEDFDIQTMEVDPDERTN